MADEFQKELLGITESVNTPDRESIDEKKKLPAAFLKNIKGKGGKPKGDDADDTGDDKKKGDGDKKKKGKGGMPDFIQKKIDAKKKKGKGKKESIKEYRAFDSLGIYASGADRDAWDAAVAALQKHLGMGVFVANPQMMKITADPEDEGVVIQTLKQYGINPTTVQAESIQRPLAEAAGHPVKVKLSAIVLGGDIDSDLNTAIKRGELDGTDPIAVSEWRDAYWEAVMYVLGAAWSVSGKEVVDKLVGVTRQEGDYSNVFLGEINRGSAKYHTMMDRIEDEGLRDVVNVEDLGMDDVIKAAGKDLEERFKYLAASVSVYLYPEPEITDEYDHYETIRELEETFDGLDIDIMDIQMDVKGQSVHTGQMVYAVERGVRTELANVLGGIRIKDITVMAKVKLPKAAKMGDRADFDVTVHVSSATSGKEIAQGEGRFFADGGVEPSTVIFSEDAGRIKFEWLPSFVESANVITVKGDPRYLNEDEKRRLIAKARERN